MEFKDIFNASVFTFLVGADEKTFQVHPQVISSLSTPLKALMGNGMKESVAGQAKLPEVEPEIFALLLEFAYTKGYELVPAATIEADGTPDKSSFLAHADTGPRPNFCGRCGGPIAAGDGGRCTRSVHCMMAGRERKGMHNQCPACGSGIASRASDAFPCGKTLACLTFSLSAAELKKLAGSFQAREYLVAEEKHPWSKKPAQNVSQHVKLYVLADQYMVLPLKQLCLFKLHRDLGVVQLSDENITDIVLMLQYAYEHTTSTYPNTDGKTETVDGLRDLVLAYAVWKAEELVDYSVFNDFLVAGGEFVSDFTVKVTKGGDQLDDTVEFRSPTFARKRSLHRSVEGKE